MNRLLHHTTIRATHRNKTVSERSQNTEGNLDVLVFHHCYQMHTNLAAEHTMHLLFHILHGSGVHE